VLAFAPVRKAMVSVFARAEETPIATSGLGRDVPWLWILVAFGLALGGVFLVWVVWGRRFPPPGQPWR